MALCCSSSSFPLSWADTTDEILVRGCLRVQAASSSAGGTVMSARLNAMWRVDQSVGLSQFEGFTGEVGQEMFAPSNDHVRSATADQLSMWSPVSKVKRVGPLVKVVDLALDA